MGKTVTGTFFSLIIASSSGEKTSLNSCESKSVPASLVPASLVPASACP